MLERARTERGISLRQAEEATMIRAKYLNDLERENFEVLPAVYILGSLKTYADYLGLDGEALSLELKSRQTSQQEERDDEPVESEGAGLPAFLAAILGFWDRETSGGDEGDARAGDARAGDSVRDPRLYWGLGAALILILTVAFVSSFGGGGQRAVSQVREPTIPGDPSRMAFSGALQDEPRSERDHAAGRTDRSPEKQTAPSDGVVEKHKEEAGKDQDERVVRNDWDDVLPTEDTGDVTVTIPASTTSSSSASSTASATSTPVASTSASTVAAVPSAAERTTASAAPDTETPDPVAQDTETREVASVAPGPTTVEPEPAAEPTPPDTVRTVSAAAGAPDVPDSRQVEEEGLDASRLSDEIFGRVDDATSFAR
ncbi:MAG: helix-turn-helix domain-containing protein [Rubrobacter sp.]